MLAAAFLLGAEALATPRHARACSFEPRTLPYIVREADFILIATVERVVGEESYSDWVHLPLEGARLTPNAYLKGTPSWEAFEITPHPEACINAQLAAGDRILLLQYAGYRSVWPSIVSVFHLHDGLASSPMSEYPVDEDEFLARVQALTGQYTARPGFDWARLIAPALVLLILTAPVGFALVRTGRHRNRDKGA